MDLDHCGSGKTWFVFIMVGMIVDGLEVEMDLELGIAEKVVTSCETYSPMIMTRFVKLFYSIR